jgi:electron transfer flavoprotein alpha subunit
MNGILVLAECNAKGVTGATTAAITAANQLCAYLGCTFDIVVVGAADEELATRSLAALGAREVYSVQGMAQQAPDAWASAEALAGMVGEYKVVCAGASDFGCEALSLLAGKLKVAYAGDCIGFDWSNGELYYKRSLYAGNVHAYVTLETSPQLVTVRQCEFELARPVSQLSPVRRIQLAEHGATNRPFRLLSRTTGIDEANRLLSARVIVAGGRPLKRRFHEVLGALAAALDGAIGATRAACIAGYAPIGLQIGQTGKRVAPRLYVAVAVSGSVQHVAGMKGSNIIVAINKDPQAPIFRIADYGLVADFESTVPELIRAIGTTAHGQQESCCPLGWQQRPSARAASDTADFPSKPQ